MGTRSAVVSVEEAGGAASGVGAGLAEPGSGSWCGLLDVGEAGEDGEAHLCLVGIQRP